MQKIKILALIFSLSLLLNSCGEYQRVAGKGTMSERYKLAVKKYEAKEFSKALRLFELIIYFNDFLLSRQVNARLGYTNKKS